MKRRPALTPEARRRVSAAAARAAAKLEPVVVSQALSGLARQARADNPGPQADIEEHIPVSTQQAAREAAATNIAADRLRSIVERVERLEEERKGLAGDIKDIFDEAKSAGFEPKVLRRLLRDRKREPAELEEEETLLDLYRRALGM